MEITHKWFALAAFVVACGEGSPPQRTSVAVAATPERVAVRALAPPRTVAPPQPVDSPVVVIDPGHPSETSAGTVQHGVREVHIAWLVALRLRDLLQRDGYRVTMTKAREDQNVRNADRARIANHAGAALMVRLHCDAAAGSGFTLYHPDRRGTAQGVTGPSDPVIRASGSAAAAVHAGMAGVLKGRLRDGGIRGDSDTYVGSRQGALTGSIFAEVPVVTIEMVVLGSRADAAFISGEDGQALMARAIAAGVRRFVPLASAARQDTTPRRR
ncbi:MAG TPA: N-acetylmuramoyl-L-alanine amidase [Longimicrobium sp.]|nr:N-acetylmuramoyl-L-alanine amidase [Longimicrobium sp.]